MQIVIDTREHELIRHIEILKKDKKYDDVTVKTKELDVGDILLCKDNTILNIMSDKEKILTAINKLSKVDASLAENLTKLAELAEKKPFIYQQAIKQLNSL